MGDEDANAALLAIARTVTHDQVAAGEQLVDWVGRELSSAGETRLRTLARLGPELVAETVTRSGWDGESGLWATGVPIADLLTQSRGGACDGASPNANPRSPGTSSSRRREPNGLTASGVATLHLPALELRDQHDDHATRLESGEIDGDTMPGG